MLFYISGYVEVKNIHNDLINLNLNLLALSWFICRIKVQLVQYMLDIILVISVRVLCTVLCS